MRNKLKRFLLIIAFIILCIGNIAVGQNLAVDHEAATNPYTALSGTASAAFDGSNGSRWESAHGVDPQWIQVELDAIYSLTQIIIDWEGANAKDYTIQLSENGTDWTTASTQIGKPEGGRTDDLTVSGNAKFVRMNGTARNLTYGYSIWEFKIYGSPAGHTSTLTTIELTAPKTLVTPSESVTITATGKDQDGFVMAVSPVWSTTGGTAIGGVFSSATKGSYTITATSGSISGTINITVGDPKITGLTATASDGTAAGAVDGNLGSLWVGDGHQKQWIYADLGAVYYLSRIKVFWEGACATKYGLDISADGANWQNIDSVINGSAAGRTDEFNTTASAKYIRIHCLVPREAAWGYKIFEIEAYGEVNGTKALNALSINAPITTINAGLGLQLILAGTDQNGDPFAVNPTWSTNSNYSIDANGIFTGTLAGAYTITATDGSVSNTISITVTEPQVLTSIVVSPVTATVAVGHDFDFNAQGKDQNAVNMTVPITWSVDGGGTIDANGLFSATTIGNFTITATSGAKAGTAAIAVKPANLALGKTIVVSSGDGSKGLAVDGNVNSRWESASSDPQWIYIDLGATYALSEFNLNWEAANAKNYTLSISADATNWQTIHTAVNMAGGARIDNIIKDASARYIRMHGTERTIPYGYSLWEFEALGVALSGQTLTSIDVVSTATTINIGETIKLEARGFDAASKPFAATPAWTVNSANATIINGVFTSNIEATYRVTATDGLVTNYLDIIVKGPELTTINLTPTTATIETGKTQQFTAVGKDQFGADIAATFSYNVDGGGSVNSSGLFSATTVGNYTLTVNEGAISATAAITVIPGNIALGKTATSLSAVQAASNATDGNVNTAWEAAAADSQYIVVNLADVYLLSKVKLNWGALTARAYTLAISADGISWQTLFIDDVNGGGAHVSEIPFNASAQYVRLLARTRNGGGGIVLNEFEIYGQPKPAGKVLATLNVVAPKTTVQVEKSLQLEAHGFDADGVAFATAPTWGINIAGATISTSGLFISTQVNSYIVTATSGSLSNTLTIVSETNARLAQVKVTPTTAKVNIGQTSTYAAQGIDQFDENFEATYNWSTSGGGIIDANGVFTAMSLGTHFITAISNSVSPTTSNVSGTAEVVVIQENLALSGSATASSAISPAANAIDNNIASYWESNANDKENIAVNLGSMRFLSKVNLNWRSSANNFNVEISADGLNWVEVNEQLARAGEQRLDEIDLVATAKYVRINGLLRNGTSGYILNEFQVLGEAVPVGKTLATLSVKAKQTSIFINDPLQLSVLGKDQVDQIFAATPTWSANGGTISTSGVFSSSTAGTYTITATDGSVTNTIDILVQAPAAVAIVNIAPAASIVQVTNTIQFAASGIDQYGNAIAISPTWSVNGGGTIDNTGLFTATTVGVFNVSVEAGSITKQAQVTVLPENLVLNKSVTALSANQPAANAVDGNLTSRWESAATDTQWIAMDMTEMHQISKVILNWETASAKAYRIDISADNSHWQPIFVSTSSAAGARKDTIKQVASARYIRMYGTKRNTAYGYSLFEVEVNGQNLPAGVLLDSIGILAETQMANVGNTIKLAAFGFDQARKPFAMVPTWQVSATGATVDANGIFSSTAEGKYIVTASQGAISRSIEITIRAASILSSIIVAPIDSSLRVGDSIAYSAKAFNQYSEPMDAAIVWTTNGGGTISSAGLFKANAVGSFVISATSGSVVKTSGVTILKGNIAKNKPVYASSQIQAARNMIDGIATSRWESAASDPQWIFVDLLNQNYISEIFVNWEGASAKTYSIDISADSVYWQTAYNVNDKIGGARVDTILKNMTARFVRINATQRNTAYGYSIFELQLIGESVPSSVTLDSLAITASRDTIPAGYKLQLKSAGYDNQGKPFAVTPVWSVNNANGKVDSIGRFSSSILGNYIVTSTVGSVTATYQVTVAEPSVLVSLTIKPIDSKIRIAQTVQFTVVGIDQYGLEMPTNVTWSSTGGGSISNAGLFSASVEGNFIVKATQDGISASTSISVLPENLALGKLAAASTAVQSAALATDGILTTRWESAISPKEWLAIDLNSTPTIKNLVLNWETASAKVYTVNVSADNLNWQQVFKSDAKALGARIDTVKLVATARYFKVEGLERTSEYGYSLFEVEAYGDKTSTLALDAMVISATQLNAVVGQSVQCMVSGFDVNKNSFAVSPVWSVVEATATINSKGEFSASKAGAYTVKANCGSLSQTLAITVVAGPTLTTIKVTPENVLAHVGDSIQFKAQGFDAKNDSIAAVYTWEVNGGGTIDQKGFFVSKTEGAFSIKAKSDTIVGLAGIVILPENIALNKVTIASSSVKPSSNVNDGNELTYWESEDASPQWIVVDFKEMYNFAAVNLIWNTKQEPSEYTLSISADSLNWQVIPIEIAKSAKPAINASTRFVKLTMISKTFVGGYKLNEFEILGEKMASDLVLDSISLVCDTTVITTSSRLQLSAQGFDKHNMPMAFVPTWNSSEGGLISTTGIFSAILPGIYNVKVTNGAFTDSISITVNGSILTSIEVTPIEAEVLLGGTLQFAAQTYDQAHVAFDSDIAWSVNGGGTIDNAGLFTATERGTFMITATSSIDLPTIVTVSGTSTVVVYKINLALNKSILASSEVENANRANDGEKVTFWESESENDQWIYIDFADFYTLQDLILNWETNSASSYELAISADGKNWQTIMSKADMENGKRIDSLLPNASAQFVRVKGIAKLDSKGYQLAEIEAYGAPVSNSKILTEIKVIASENEILGGTTLQLESHGFDQDEMPYAAVPVWSVNNGGLISTDGKFVSTTAGIYTITSTNSGVSGTFSITVIGTGVEVNLNDNMLIYSSQNSIFITNIKVEECSEIQVFNSLGKIVKNVKIDANQVEISTMDLHPGMYIVSAMGNKIVNKRVIVK